MLLGGGRDKVGGSGKRERMKTFVFLFRVPVRYLKSICTKLSRQGFAPSVDTADGSEGRRRGWLLPPPLPFHSSSSTYKHTLQVPRMCVGSEVGLVLTHARSHVALLARRLAALTVPQVSIPSMGEHLPTGKRPLHEQAHATLAPFQRQRGSPGKWDALARVVLPEGFEQPGLVHYLYFFFFSFIYVS